MGVFSKFKDLMGFEEYEEDEVEVEEEEYNKQGSYYDRKPVEPRQHTPAAPKFDNNVVPMQNRTVKALTNAFKLVVIEPKGFDECSKLVDSLKSRKPIIVNLEKLDSDTARKIFDFLGGATYALNGNVQKVANNIFVFAPENVAIFADGENKPYNFSGGAHDDANPWK
ncbi:MAG: cell division protein SepF [Anaerovoracaceae bacterium]|nr:cell division protein SepF [Anaerovoracaceae bacterium]